MIEKIKYCFSGVYSRKPMRVGCLTVMAVATAAVITLLSYSVYTVNIFDGEKSYTVKALTDNVLSVSSILSESEDYTVESTEINGRNASVKISYTYPVYITCGEKTVTVNVSDCTVEEALNVAGYTVDEFDFVEPQADTLITDTVYIDYTDVEYISGTYEEKIPYETQTVYSSKLEKGKTSLTEGSNGVRLVSYTEKLVNGISVEKKITDTSVTTEAVAARNIIGTGEVKKAVKTSEDVKSISVLSPSKEIELDGNGNPVSYKSKLTVRATAYTYTGNKCATGVSPKPGYIAVNPKVIPYGTKLYIKSANGSVIYGYAVAADTGGFVKNYPNGIDLFMSSKSACVAFGVRNMEVYILE